MDELKDCVEVDARALHESVIFFQDRGSRYTVAVDRETGEVLGKSAERTAAKDARVRVLREVLRYQQSRTVKVCPKEYGRSSARLIEMPDWLHLGSHGVTVDHRKP